MNRKTIKTTSKQPLTLSLLSIFTGLPISTLLGTIALFEPELKTAGKVTLGFLTLPGLIFTIYGFVALYKETTTTINLKQAVNDVTLKFGRFQNQILIKTLVNKRLNYNWITGNQANTKKLNNILKILRNIHNKKQVSCNNIQFSSAKKQKNRNLPPKLQKILQNSQILFSTKGLYYYSPLFFLVITIISIGLLSFATLLLIALIRIFNENLMHTLILSNFLLFSYGLGGTTFSILIKDISLTGYHFIGTPYYLIIYSPKMIRFIGWNELTKIIKSKKLFNRGIIKLEGSYTSHKNILRPDIISLYAIKDYHKIDEIIKNFFYKAEK